MRAVGDAVRIEPGTRQLQINCVLGVRIIMLLGKMSGTQISGTGSYFGNTGSLSEQGPKGNGVLSES